MRGKWRTFSVAAAGGLVLLFAVFAGTAAAKDRNHDAIPDKWEKKFHLSLKKSQANKDQDRDKVDNLNEFQEGTNPRRKDTNRNGRPDGKEDSDHDGLNNHMEDVTANLPDDQDTDNDGTMDGAENAGVIANWDGTTLTIDLQGGGQVFGAVTDQTEIKCETESEQEDDNSGMASASSDGGADDGISGSSSDDGSGDDSAGVCTTADLVPGTAVHEAELAGTTFEEIELIK